MKAIHRFWFNDLVKLLGIIMLILAFAGVYIVGQIYENRIDYLETSVNQMRDNLRDAKQRIEKLEAQGNESP
jgi:hypothetical protein